MRRTSVRRSAFRLTGKRQAQMADVSLSLLQKQRPENINVINGWLFSNQNFWFHIWDRAHLEQNTFIWVSWFGKRMAGRRWKPRWRIPGQSVAGLWRSPCRQLLHHRSENCNTTTNSSKPEAFSPTSSNWFSLILSDGPGSSATALPLQSSPLLKQWLLPLLSFW